MAVTQQAGWPEIEAGWMAQIGDVFDTPDMKNLAAFLHNEEDSGHVVYPAKGDMFNALNMTPFESVRVVVIGQDPYHGPDQAHGLAFSVREGVPVPPSLKNIYKELDLEYGAGVPQSGDLTHWARQGVLLLNATLTVRQGQAGSHQKKGWEHFTDSIIAAVNEHHAHIVFMLWGAYAQKKGSFIDRDKHQVLEAPHPSPLSAHRGFLGCGHFRQANEYLLSHGRGAIGWTGNQND